MLQHIDLVIVIGREPVIFLVTRWAVVILMFLTKFVAIEQIYHYSERWTQSKFLPIVALVWTVSKIEARRRYMSSPTLSGTRHTEGRWLCLCIQLWTTYLKEYTRQAHIQLCDCCQLDRYQWIPWCQPTMTATRKTNMVCYVGFL